jgi:hypothetical protein
MSRGERDHISFRITGISDNGKKLGDLRFADQPGRIPKTGNESRLETELA